MMPVLVLFIPHRYMPNHFWLFFLLSRFLYNFDKISSETNPEAFSNIVLKQQHIFSINKFYL